jgi:hypothetical protein
MTDKWNEIARKIVDIEWELSPSILCPAIAQALRDAEKAGMERAADKIDEMAYAITCPEEASGLIRSICAAKKTKP